MCPNTLEFALKECGIFDVAWLKLQEAGLVDLDLIAAAFVHVRDLASWWGIQQSDPLESFFRKCQANARAAVQSCVSQVPLPTVGVSGRVHASSSVRPSPVPVKFKVVQKAKRKRRFTRNWPRKKLAASSMKRCWKTSLFDRLIEEHAQLGTSAKDWSVVSCLSPYLFEQRLSLQRVPLSTLPAALTALRRWKAWCVENVESSVEPCAVHVALWLRSLDGQLTVPAVTFAAIKWLETHLSFTFFVRDPEVAHRRSLPVGYKAAQVRPFTIIQWFELEKAAVRANGVAD